MPMLRLAPLLGCAIALLCAATAVAAPPWSAPATITTGNPQLAQPTIDFAGNGRAVLSARLTTQANGVPSNGFSRLFGQQVDGSFAGRARLVLAAPPVAYGSSRLALLRLPVAKGNVTIADLEDPASSLGTSFGRCCGPLAVDPGGYRRLSARAARDRGVLAADDRGDVAAVWVEHLSGRDHLLVAQRRPGQAFGRPAVIAGSGLITAPSVAWSPRGDLLVAYQRATSGPRPGTDRRVEARVRRSGHSWGGPQRLGLSSGFSVISTAAAADGRMVVAWGTQDLGQEANTRWNVRAALRPAGSRGFGYAELLESSEGDDERPAGRVVAAMAPDGTATVAWSSIAGARSPHTFPARVATAGPAQGFGPMQTLAPNAAVGDVAMDARSATVVVWATLAIPGVSQVTQQVFASLRGAGAAAFAAPEAVGPAERAELPRAAFEPLSGRPAVVWISRMPGVTERLRYSGRVL